MESETVQSFVEEIAAEMPAIRRGILVCAQHGGNAEDLFLPLELTQTIRAGSASLALADIERCSADLEITIATFAAAFPVSQGDVAKVLDQLSALEEAIISVGMQSGDQSLDVASFVGESFDMLQIGGKDIWGETADAAPEPSSVEEELSGFDIDEELLEIFAMEAEGLLKSLHTSLEAMAINPQDKDALWEIRRNAHTFKGAAGIVGLKKPSELAHRIEDLLDRLGEYEAFSTAEVIEILQRSIECLDATTNGENSPQLLKRITELYQRFDVVLATAIAPPAAIEAENEVVIIPEPSQVIVFPVLAAEPAAVLAVPGLVPSPIPDIVHSAETSRPPAHQKRHIVRVSLTRLDELVRITRDLLVGRSVFEQRLRELEQQIDELHNATRRLQNTSNRLEIDFEGSMLGSGVTARPSLNAPAGHGASDTFDELEFDRYTGFHQCTRQLSEAASDTFEINNALDSVRGSFVTLFDQQRTLVEEMQEKLMRIRMVEFGSLATRLQRVVAVTSEDESKKVRIVIENEKLELDTQILDALTEPLLHLLKNAVVHGIESPDTRRLIGKPETGLITLRVENEDTHVVLTLSDDGRGISPVALKEKAVEAGVFSIERAATMPDEVALELLFLPGLTTAEKVNLSAGRGVGMSIVKEIIDSRKGTISIESLSHKGTSFIIRLPLTLAITNVLLVKAGSQTVAIPVKPISRITEIASEKIRVDAAGGRSVEVESENLSFHYLGDVLGQSDGLPLTDSFLTLNVETAGRKFGIAVDAVLRAEEVIIKPLGRPLESIKGVLGAAVLGNGELVAILDLPHLLTRKMQPMITSGTIATPAAKPSIMVVDDSPSVRHMTSKIIANAGWTVMTAKDGIEALEQLNAAVTLPAVILSDIEMPRMDGYELLASIGRTETLSHIPVVMITSRAGSKHREKAFESGVAEYLTKPFEDKELVELINRLSRKND